MGCVAGGRSLLPSHAHGQHRLQLHPIMEQFNDSRTTQAGELPNAKGACAPWRGSFMLPRAPASPALRGCVSWPTNARHLPHLLSVSNSCCC